MLPRHPLLALRDRLAKSRVFTISLTFHAVLIVVFGGKVVIERVIEPSQVTASIVEQEAAPPPPRAPEPSSEALADMPVIADLPGIPPINDKSLFSDKPVLGDFTKRITPPHAGSEALADYKLQPAKASDVSTLTGSDLQRIEDFTKPWTDGKKSDPVSKRSFSFTAFVGRTQQGNWDSTIRRNNNKITGGSLPNLLYAMDKWSKGKIDTNERNVRAIALDSEELLTVRPPFIFLTGTQDFKLTQREVENLRTYIRCGGAVWGDSSVPGRRSAFDNAFRREMQIVLGGDAAKFEPLPKNHSVYTAGYFPSVRQEPAGLNNYREPVEVLRWNGEIAILHTRNDYGDMWQIGLDAKGQIDLSRNERGEYIAMDPVLWAHRGVYVRNIEQPAVEEAYRFGINVVIHLVTRWESKVSSAPTL